MSRTALVLLCVLVSRTGVVRAADAPHVTIPKVSVAPRLQDYLDGTGPGLQLNDFRQRDPGDLVPVSEGTTAFLSYDATHLYVAFVCRASNPGSIRARLSRRESIFSDDYVGVFLDPFQERQRAYMFLSNPIGVQADGIRTEDQGDDMSFDTVWRSSGRLTSTGYVVLLAIPFRSLRFPETVTDPTPAGWGIALQRAIPNHSEESFWPGITRRVNGFTSQFGSVDGISGVSPGRNIQLLPYGTFTGARLLEDDALERTTTHDERAGLDAKLVVRDAVAVDATVNPDFSQVESDEPQVTINQRFEVFFPEKRPFFLENADYFQAPITLFFSRRIRDPEFGARATGRLGRWALGALAMDDRRDGPSGSDRAANLLVRGRRDFSNQSRAGFLITSRTAGPLSNRVISGDTRLRLNAQWFFEGQGLETTDTDGDGRTTQGRGIWAALHRSGRKYTEDVFYQDLSPDLHARLGFVPRTDIRQVQHFATWRWRPKSGPVTSFGPNSFVQATWDHQRTVQDWIVRFPFNLQMGQTFFFARHAEMYERFADRDFRERENVVNVFSSALRWMDVGVTWSGGTRPNFFPAAGIDPFLANFTDTALSLTFRPLSRLLLDETYLYSRLAQRGVIFDNHIARSRVNYQFTRELSLRTILDYSAILPDTSRVALDRRKHLAADVLFTWLTSPGTATYIGYADGYDNVQPDPVAGRTLLTGSPTTSTGRQFFVKTSYLFRF